MLDGIVINNIYATNRSNAIMSELLLLLMLLTISDESKVSVSALCIGHNNNKRSVMILQTDSLRCRVPSC